MFYSKLFFSCCLAACSFSFAAYPIEPIKMESQVYVPFTYDDIMGIFERAEEEGLESYSEEQAERIFQLFVFLSRLGVLPGEDAERLEEDIKEILEDEYDSYVCEITFENIGMKIREIFEGYR